MKLGIAKALLHSSPKEWAEKHCDLGLSAVVFPVNCKSSKQTILDYKHAANDYGLVIAEVGAWCNLLDKDKNKANENLNYSLKTMEMAESISAKCVVNISGSLSDKQWDGGTKENYSQQTFNRVVSIIKKIISVADKCCFTIEPMPWMIPYDADNYLQILKEVNDSRFAVHMDAVNMIYSPKKYFFQKEYLDEIFEKIGKHIISSHLKDLTLSNKLTFQLSECAPLEGEFETAYYLNKLTTIDKNMPVIIEHLSSDEEYVNAVNKLKDFCQQLNICI